MRRNMARLKKIIHSFRPTLDLVVDCLEWRSTFHSGMVLTVEGSCVVDR